MVIRSLMDDGAFVSLRNVFSTFKLFSQQQFLTDLGLVSDVMAPLTFFRQKLK